MTDHFEDYEATPANVRAIIDTFDDNTDMYAECKRLIKELEAVGWTAEYGLDGVLYALRPK